MEPVHGHFAPTEHMDYHNPAWEQQHDWSQSATHWDSNSTSSSEAMPIWQYTAAALNRPDGITYYPTEAPLSPVSNHGPSPSTGSYASNGRFPNIAANYRLSSSQYAEQTRIPTTYGENFDIEEEDEEDSDTHTSWDAQPSPNLPTPPHKPGHRRNNSATDATSRSAKRAHTVVERNYRERLNDKIADLALYLFDTSSDSRTKPSKSLVMTRAKERLKQLEAQNKTLEIEVVRLRQQIAILDHIVASTRGPEAQSGSLTS
ncbi:hypothetical protein PVAG01_10995 [Phlyctema vagabunda]|uniref:BHLH domain-containing protein n=1 Tax=Phlyctema vagabunda TaxID=108571 RepID=A0ABR4P3V1_9HELO